MASPVHSESVRTAHCTGSDEQRIAGEHGVLSADRGPRYEGARPLGPSLRGAVGRPAASAAGFPYSDALKKSGLTWTEDNLRAWIADPSHTVPGTLMPHVSLSDPAEQLYVIAYLKTLSGKAAR